MNILYSTVLFKCLFIKCNHITFFILMILWIPQLPPHLWMHCDSQDAMYSDNSELIFKNTCTICIDAVFQLMNKTVFSGWLL